MLTSSTQFRSIQNSAYFTPKKVASVSFGVQSEPKPEATTSKTLAKRVGICIAASGLGHYFLGEQAHELAEHLLLLPHWLGHIISDSAVCCGIPTGVAETVIEERPEKGLGKQILGFIKALGKNIGKNFALSAGGHLALGVPAEMVADGLQAATNASPKIATAISEAALCCGVPSATLETKSSWLPKRWLKKTAVKKSTTPLNVEA